MPLLQIRGSNGFFFRIFAHCNKSDRARKREGIDDLGGCYGINEGKAILKQHLKKTVAFETEAQKETQTLPRRPRHHRHQSETAKVNAAIQEQPLRM